MRSKAPGLVDICNELAVRQYGNWQALQVRFGLDPSEDIKASNQGEVQSEQQRSATFFSV
jgi:hypothetical protein